MTNLSDAYRKLADAFLETANAIDEAVGDDLPPIPDTPTLQALPVQKPQVYTPPNPLGAESVVPPQEFHGNAATTCPIHGVEYRKGNYGPYCAESGAMPWADRKGFCSMPGKNNANALEYVKAQATLRR